MSTENIFAYLQRQPDQSLPGLYQAAETLHGQPDFVDIQRNTVKLEGKKQSALLTTVMLALKRLPKISLNAIKFSLEDQISPRHIDRVITDPNESAKCLSGD